MGSTWCEERNIKADRYHFKCKNHKNYDKLKENAKETFINYLREVKAFLSVEEHVNDYRNLARSAFKSKEIATKNLKKQLEFTERGISLIENDPSLLSLIAGKKIIIKALRKGFEETKKEFFKGIDETYD